MAHRGRLRERVIRNLHDQRMAWLSRRGRRGRAFPPQNPLAALFRHIDPRQAIRPMAEVVNPLPVIRPIAEAVNPRPGIREAREAERVLPEREEEVIEEEEEELISSSESEDDEGVILIGKVLSIRSFTVPPSFNSQCFTCQSRTDLLHVLVQGFSFPKSRVFCRICLDRQLKRTGKPIKAAADSSGTYQIHSSEVRHSHIILDSQYQIGDKIQPAENFYSIDSL